MTISNDASGAGRAIPGVMLPPLAGKMEKPRAPESIRVGIVLCAAIKSESRSLQGAANVGTEIERTMSWKQ
jgi:hypothetical protein